MARPSHVTLTKKEQAQVLKAWKTCKNARTIAEQLGFSRHHVMYFVETQGLTSFSESSYR
jgi:predicted ester cyclase